jgi:hypothetical protein
MHGLGPISILNQTAIPSNSQIVPILDSTYWAYAAPWTTTASLAAPGKSRGQLAGARVYGTILVTDQNATAKFYLLTNPSGTTSGAWELDGNIGTSGAVTLTAGTGFSFNWLPYASDFLITITAGANNPDAVYTNINLTWDRSSGA